MTQATVYPHSHDNPALREQYRKAGFGGRVGWGERAAILVIDMAGAWTHRDEQLGSDLSSVLDSIKTLLAVARGKGLPIYFTTMAYDPALREVGEVARRKLPHLEHMIRGSDRVQLEPSLERRGSEPLIEKPRASAFRNTNLLSELISERIDTTIIVGCSTSGCIRATCESAFDLNFHAIVPREAVGDRSPSAHAASLFDIDMRLADVMALSDVISHLEGMPDRIQNSASATAELHLHTPGASTR
jgi:nicotinamidase-related amidase